MASDNSKVTFVLSFLGLCCINLIAAVDSSALSVSLPVIASAFRTTDLEAYWAGTSFVLASAVLVALFPAFSNAFGRKPALLAALILFTIGTIVAGTARHVGALLAGRAIQGAGGGGLLAMTYVVIADLLPLHKRPGAMAVISLVWLLGSSVAPIIGGGFSEFVTWRWIFWICLPFAGISLVLVTFFLRTPHRSLHPKEAMMRIDWVGTVLFVASLTSFLIAISWGGTMFPWSSWHTLVPLILGAVGMLGWLVFEKYVSAAPLLPLAVLGNITALSSFIGTMLLGIMQFGLLYYLPLYYQVCKGYSPLIAGVALLVQCAAVGPTSAFSGVYMNKTGGYRLLTYVGWAFMILGAGLLNLLSPDTSVPAWVFINLPSGIGLGFLFASLPIAAQAAAPPQHMAIAAGLTPFFRNIGQALGIVLGNTIFQNVLRNNLQRSGVGYLRDNASLLVDNSATITFLRELRANPILGNGLLRAYNNSLRIVWWTLFAFACLGGLLSLFMKQISLRKPTAPKENESSGVSSEQGDGAETETVRPEKDAPAESV